MLEAPPPASAAFRALSDATRLRLLHLLRAGPLCVGDLVAVLGVPQPKASRHLEVLRRAGLVEDDKRGLWRFYRLSPARSPFHRRLLGTLDAAAAELPESAADQAALQRLQAKGGCCPRHSGGGR